MYTNIIHPLRKAMNLSCNEYCVLDTIYHLSNNFDYGGWCIKSKQNIANDLDLSKQTVITIIDTLVKKGLVVRHETTKNLRIGKFYVEAMQEKSAWIAGKGGEESFTYGCFTDGKETVPVVKEIDHDRSRNFTASGKETLPNIYINNNNDNNILVELISFDEFWKLYPNKVGKTEAKKKWDKLSESDKLKIKQTIDSFVKHKPFEKYNHPNPTTYLNQKRWEDEINVETSFVSEIDLEKEMNSKYSEQQIKQVKYYLSSGFSAPSWFDMKYYELVKQW